MCVTPEKEAYYENATRKLLKTIDGMGLGLAERARAKSLVLLFRDSFKLTDVKYATFSQDTDIKYFTYDSDGFCRASSIDFALMMGGEPNWQVKYLSKLWVHGPHHYLLHKPSKTVLDLTYDQYTHSGLEIPYELGIRIPYSMQAGDSPERFAKAVGLTPLIKQKD